MSTHIDRDIIVVGGGVAGAAAAALLANQGHQVALVDVQDSQFKPPAQAMDPRVVAVSVGSQRILDAAGGWERLDPTRLAPYGRMEVLAERGELVFNADQHGLDQLGWIVELPAMRQALWTHLRQHPNAQVMAPVSWTQVTQDDDEVRLHLNDGQTLHAPLLIAADGGRSDLRHQLALPVDAWHYNQMTLFAQLTSEHPNTGLTWQRFYDDGPLGFLALPGGHSSLAWSLPSERARELQAMPDDAFLEALNARQDSPLGRIVATGPRHALPLVRRQARKLTKGRVVLLGDAARSVHPMAGQGLNIALADAGAIAELLDSPPLPNDSQLQRQLQRYHRWRHSAGTLLAGAIHGFNELNRLPLGVGRHAMGASMLGSKWLWPIRDIMVRRACGIDGDSPKIARQSVSQSAHQSASTATTESSTA